MTAQTEADVESAALDLLASLGWETAYGPDISPGTPAAERDNYAQVVLEGSPRDALERLNPDVDTDGLETAVRRITTPTAPPCSRIHAGDPPSRPDSATDAATHQTDHERRRNRHSAAEQSASPFPLTSGTPSVTHRPVWFSRTLPWTGMTMFPGLGKDGGDHEI